jgi:Cu(I)/Ag(I) efflux system membrane fusion protein
MTRKTWILSALAAMAAASAVAVAWWIGMQQGMAMISPPPAVASAPVDPSQWTIAQGEEATRRHLRDGLKAGDIDPVTGLRILHYHDPMVPGRKFDAPGKSPFMDMMLVPRYAGADGAGGADPAGVTVSPRIRQNLGLRTTEVVQGRLTREIDAVGSVAWNERKQVVLTARAKGFVEKLHVRATLDRVAAGAPLLEILIPDWAAAQEEYLAVARMSGPGVDALREAAHARLRLAGMDEVQVERFVAAGRVQPRITLTAPLSGIVSELMVREGATVMPDMPLLRLQGTGSVWAEAQVPESQAAQLQPGAAVTATSPALPGQNFRGRVQALLPEVDPATRTRRARLELNNAGGALVPGMTVQMRFTRTTPQPTLLVPSDAVIHTGRRSVVMLAEDEGHFRPVVVRTGLEANGQTEIVDGLRAGQRVVLAGQFLLDSEASLRGLEARLDAEPAAQQVAKKKDKADGTPAGVHRTEARIVAIDRDTVTLDHPPVASVNWPAMVMPFRLPPPAQRPRDLAVGERVRVEFRLQTGDLPLIVSIQRLAPAAGGPAR